MPAINYATQYAQELSQAYPYVLNFGDLYATPNNGRYKWTGAKTIEIPSISTTGRVDSSRDTLAVASRNYDNSWEPKTLTNQRKWSNLVHPADVDQTNQVASIANITQVYNDEQKFPEMDAYCISKVFADWTALSNVAVTTALTTDNVLEVFDVLMKNQTEARVPANNRILYVNPDTNTLIKNAKAIQRTLNVQDGTSSIKRTITDIDNVKIIEVPSELMKTAYDFTQGWKVGTGAKQIKMALIHPNSVITPVSYQFSKLDEVCAGLESKYVYFE